MRIDRIHSDNLGLVRNEFQSELIGINSNESGQSEWIWMNPNFRSESIRKIRFHSDWFRIHSDWFGLTGLILITSLDWFWMGLGLKIFFGLDRNETVWFGYEFRNDSENFGLVRNEFQSETLARGCFSSDLNFNNN